MAVILGNRDLDAGAHRFARALDRAGVGTRDTVAVLLGNTPEFLWAYRGTTWSGRRFTPLGWRWTPEDVAYVVADSEARALVADARFREAALAAARFVPERARFCVGGAIPGFRPWQNVDVESSDPLENPLAGDTMLYTSGTTGRPKGVQRSSFPEGPPPTLVGRAGMEMMKAFLPGEARDGAHLVVAPLYHAGPSTYCDGAALLGANLVLMEHFDPEDLLHAIDRHRVTSVFLVPTHFVRMLRLSEEVRARYDLSSLRLVLHGAAPVSIDVKRRMIDWLGPILFEFYGGTEGGGCMISSHEWLLRPGSVGKPRPGTRVRILDDRGEELPPRSEGQVYFALDVPFVYKGDPEKTAEGRRGDWFTLGDIGWVDEDGYLFLCDRRADVIVSGGVNLYPSRIEDVLLQLSWIEDCCVVGIPNDEWGEEVRAVIQIDSGRAPAPSEIESRVLEHCRARLGAHEVPRSLDLRAEIPRTETGKLARREVRAPYWAGRSRRI